jgi:hypothetical protein
MSIVTASRGRSTFARLSAFLFIFIALANPNDLTAADALPVNIDAHRLSVAGVPPGGEILFVGYDREPRKYAANVRRHRALRTADSQGIAQLEPHGGVRSDSVWVAIDVNSGRLGVTAPEGSELRHAPIPEDVLKKDNSGQLRKFLSKLPFVYVVVVRPGAGVWELFAGDGGIHDNDKTVDGDTEILLADVKSIGKERSAPSNFRKDDVLILFSPEHVAVWTLRIEK